MARPENLDDPAARRRTQHKTNVLFQGFDPGTLWRDYGVRDDIVVRSPVRLCSPS